MDAPKRISVEFNEAGFPVGTWVGGFGQDSTTYIRADLMAELVEALRWYGEQSRLARLIHSEGDAGRHAIAADGGKRAAAAIAKIKEATP